MTLVPSNCFSPIKAEVIRLIRLDDCGLPVTGVGSAQIAVIDGFTEIQNSPQYEDGQRFLLKKANGQPCVNQKDPSFLNWLQQTVNLCTLDPLVPRLVASGDAIFSSTTGIGYKFNDQLLSRHFSLEAWQPIAGSAGCVGGQKWFYWAFFNMFDSKFQDFSFQNDVTQFGWQAISAEANTAWYTTLNTAGIAMTWWGGEAIDSTMHYAFKITSTPPPTAYCGIKDA